MKKLATLMVILLLVTCFPQASLSLTDPIIDDHLGGKQIELLGVLKITQLDSGEHSAVLALQKPANFLQVVGADGVERDYRGAIEIQVLAPNKHNNKLVRVSGTLAGREAGAAYQLNCVVKGAVVTPVTKAARVTMGKKSASVNIGETVQLSARVSPATAPQELSWSSNNDAIATVDQSGLVRGVSKGSCTITAQSNDGKKASCKLTVKIPATGITISETSITLKKGKSFKLKASVLPENASNKKIIWGTSYAKQVSCKNGVVTARESDCAVMVYATTADGAFRAECIVSVPAKTGSEKPLSHINLRVVNGDNCLRRPGDRFPVLIDPWPLSAKLPEIRYSSSAPSVASVDGKGMVSVHAPGIAVITASTGLISERTGRPIEAYYRLYSSVVNPGKQKASRDDLAFEYDGVSFSVPLSLAKAQSLFPGGELSYWGKKGVAYRPKGAGDNLILQWSGTKFDSLIAYFADGKFSMKRGVRAGDNIDKVLSLYGRPTLADLYQSGFPDDLTYDKAGVDYHLPKCKGLLVGKNGCVLSISADGSTGILTGVSVGGIY